MSKPWKGTGARMTGSGAPPGLWRSWRRFSPGSAGLLLRRPLRRLSTRGRKAHRPTSLPLGRRTTWGTTTVQRPEELTMTTSAAIRRAAAASFALAFWAALAAPARADDALRTEIVTVAKGIAEAVKGLGHEA